jgi:hypothetical protein
MSTKPVMDFVIKYGKRVAVLRPEDPRSAIAHALKAERTQKWSNYPGAVKFIGYLAANGGKLGTVLNEEGEVIGNLKPGDVFARVRCTTEQLSPDEVESN